MGVCLCKDKIVDGQNDTNLRSAGEHGGASSGGGGGGGHQSSETFQVRKLQHRWLAETVDELVFETLHVIGSIVDK